MTDVPEPEILRLERRLEYLRDHPSLGAQWQAWALEERIEELRAPQGESDVN